MREEDGERARGRSQCPSGCANAANAKPTRHGAPFEFINPAFLLGKDESVPAAELLDALAGNIPAGTGCCALWKEN